MQIKTLTVKVNISVIFIVEYEMKKVKGGIIKSRKSTINRKKRNKEIKIKREKINK